MRLTRSARDTWAATQTSSSRDEDYKTGKLVLRDDKEVVFEPDGWFQTHLRIAISNILDCETREVPAGPVVRSHAGRSRRITERQPHANSSHRMRE